MDEKEAIKDLQERIEILFKDDMDKIKGNKVYVDTIDADHHGFGPHLDVYMESETEEGPIIMHCSFSSGSGWRDLMIALVPAGERRTFDFGEYQADVGYFPDMSVH